MARFIPSNAEMREFPAAAVIAYFYESDRGPAFIAYKGRQSKPVRFIAFRDSERREAGIAELVKDETDKEDFKRARRDEGHALLAGDILFSSWGYDQTNVDFFEVIRVPSGRSAVVRKIEKTTIPLGNMSGEVTPKPGQFDAGAKAATQRAAGKHCLNGGKLSPSYLSKWSGRPLSVTSYA